MTDNKHNRMTGWGDYITSTISVTLVLFILGLVGAVNITFSGVSKHLKENLGFTVMLTDSIAAEAVEAIKSECEQAPYISEFQYFSADDMLKEQTADDGTDLVELLGVNPYSPMVEIKVTEPYANVDSIGIIADHWRNKVEVQDVSVNTEMIGNLTRNANFINLILIIMAAALLLISFVLINNTVRLTVYARRFLIHTMKLVGAKGSFIRRPFLKVNIIEGILAGILASGMLAALVGWAHTWEPQLSTMLPWRILGFVFGGLLVAGALICLVAAVIATNRYLRKEYDEMFRE